MDLVSLRQALVNRMGKTLDPLTCAEIQVECQMPASRYIDLEQFEPRVTGRYRIGAERFDAALRELHPLHEMHWQESEGHRHGLHLDPDYDFMSRKDRLGELIQFTVRCDGILVGNLRMYIEPSAHTRTLIATEDTLFVHPDHRGGLLGLKLVRYAEVCLKKLGVREINANSKLVNGADVLMRRLGYAAVAIQFTKVFGNQ